MTTYTGSHSLIFSGASASPGGTSPTVVNSSGTAVAFGSATAINFSSGVASVSSSRNGVMRLYRSGATTIDVREGAISSSPDLAVNVASGALSKVTLAATTTTPTAGSPDNLTVTAGDTYGNTATSYAGSVSLTFAGSSASPNATLPTVVNSSGAAINFGSPTEITFTTGVAKVSSSKNGVMKLSRSGVASITASDGTISTSTPLEVTVSPGSASR